MKLVNLNPLGNIVSQSEHIYDKSKCNLVSDWHKHKIKVLVGVGTLIVVIAAAVFYKYKDVCWTADPSDEFNPFRCIEGKWIEPCCYCPPPDALDSRIELCAKGIKAPGCVDGKYFHYLSSECLKNPNGWRCGERDPAKFVGLLA